MPLIIPTSQTEPHYTQRTPLDGRDFVLTFDWNERDRSWYLSIADQDGLDIVVGLQIVADFPLTARVTDDRKPPGTLMALDITGGGIDPQFADLGDRVLLTYFTAAELVANGL